MTNTNNISLYARCNQQAETENARKWDQIRHEQTLGVLECNGHQRVKEPGKYWWQDKTLWADNSPQFSITEAEAFQAIYRECGGVVSSLYQLLVDVTAELLHEEMGARYYQHQLPLPELLGRRGRTLEWVKLNPSDTEPTRFEVPLERAG